ncbi:hypothetical protein MJL79_30190, partial [Salmonella enterica subsp. enterica serovar Montevideo]|nr:hypothetical protein [Salmonella enterica subsp. enterica serovar Montevideo]
NAVKRPCQRRVLRRFFSAFPRAYPIRAILLAILDLGSARQNAWQTVTTFFIGFAPVNQIAHTRCRPQYACFMPLF